MSVMIVIMITINVGIKVIKRQLMNKNQLKIKRFKQVKHINYRKNISYEVYLYTVHSDSSLFFFCKILKNKRYRVAFLTESSLKMTLLQFLL